MDKGIRNWKRDFNLLWSGQAISILTSSVLQMAIVWYLTEKTGSSALLSFATLIGFLPQAVLGTFIGVFIDRYDRKLIMICADLFIAAASLVLVVVGFYGEIPIWMILVVLFVRSIGTAFHYPALQALTPMIVPKEKLTKYAGFAQSFESISMVASPALAAVLFNIWDLNIIILLDVIGAMFACFMLCFVKVNRQPSEEKPETSVSLKSKENQVAKVINEVKEGLSILKKERGLIGLLLISALYAIIYFPIGTLYPLITMEYFGGSFSESSVVEVVFSIGMLAGSLLLGVFGEKIDKRRAIISSIAVYGMGVMIAGLLPANGLRIFILLSAVMGVSVPFYTGVETAIIQTKIEEKYLGRILSLTGSISTITMPIGLILSGIFADMIGVHNWFFILGIAALLLAMIAVILPSLKQCCED